MSILDIRVLGDPILRAETNTVTEISAELQRLIDDMFETMHAAEGIGLAAPQVGRSEQLAIVHVENNPLVLINPEIVFAESSDKNEEGCLSIPDIYGEVERPARVVVRATDRTGQLFELDTKGLESRAIQHEIDHLHGRLFIDYLSLLKRRAALAKWESMKDKYPNLSRKLAPVGARRESSALSDGHDHGHDPEEVL